MGFWKWLKDLDRKIEENFPTEYTVSDLIDIDLAGNPRPRRYEKEPRTPPFPSHRIPDLTRELPLGDIPPHHVLFGGRFIPVRDLMHTFITGTTGSGKSLQLLMILAGLAKEVSPGRDHRLMIVGSKDDAYRMLTGMGIPHLVMNMEDPESPGWDIAADYDSPLLIEELSQILLPPDSHSSDPFWQNTARAVVTGIMLSFNLLHGKNWGFDDIFNALFCPTKDIITILEQHPNNRAIVTLLEQKDLERLQFGVLAQANSTLRRLLPFAVHCQKARHHLSIERDFLGSEVIWLIQPSPQTMAVISPVIQAMFKALSEKVSALPEGNTKRRVFIALDEAQYLGKIPGIDRFLEFTRSKGGRLLLCTQSIEGLLSQYGEKEGKNILGLFPYKAILRLDSADSAEWAVKSFGSVEVWAPSRNHTRTAYSATESESYSWQVMQKIQDSDVLTLPFAHPEVGISAFYSIPKAPKGDPDSLTEYRYRTPAKVVRRFLPPMPDLPPRPAKEIGDYTLTPWTDDEWRRFVRPDITDSAQYRDAMRRAQAKIVKEFLKELFS